MAGTRRPPVKYRKIGPGRYQILRRTDGAEIGTAERGRQFWVVYLPGCRGYGPLRQLALRDAIEKMPITWGHLA